MDKNLSGVCPELKKLKGNDALKLISDLSQEQKNPVYLVGGALRDLFCREKKDSQKAEWDFAVKHQALGFAKKLAKKLAAHYVVLDKAKSTARVIYKCRGKEYCFDFTGFRSKTLKQDIKKRDFTINTLCADVTALVKGDAKILDYCGGLGDIKKKRLKAVSRGCFKDDPLRILRGFAFSARLKFKIDAGTLDLVLRSAKQLSKVSGERTAEELAKIFSSDNAYGCVKKMDELGVMEKVFPEITRLKGVDQGRFHHLDVWEHSLESLFQIEKLLKTLPENIPAQAEEYLQVKISGNRSRLWLLKLACVLHDIAKPQTRFIGPDKRVHFYTHEAVGAGLVRKIGKRLKLSNKEIKILSELVFYHLRAGQLVNRRPSRKAKFRFLRDTKENAVLISLLAISDRRAMQGVLSKSKDFVFYEDELFKLIRQYFKEKNPKTKKPRLIDGYELMSLLGIAKGPVIGDILRQIEEAQAIKTIKNKQQAEQLALKIYAKSRQ